MRYDKSLIGIFANVFTKNGFQNWLSSSTEEEYSLKVPEYAYTPIEKITKDEIGKWVMQVTEYGIEMRDNHRLNENRESCRNLYNGEYWNELNIDENSSKIITNWLKEMIRSRAAYSTANTMSCSAYSVESGDITTSSFVSDIISGIFYLNKMKVKTYDLRIESEVLGTTYLRMEWDKELSPPYGDVKIRLVQPDRVVSDWLVEDIQEGRFVAELHYRTIEQIKQAYPTKASKFENGLNHKGDIMKFDKKDMLMLVEMFCQDKTVITETFNEEVVDEFTGIPTIQEVKRQVLKYPNGRRIVVCEGVVISDDPVPMHFKKNGVSFPFAASRGSRQPHEQYGVSTVDEYQSMVRDIIKREGAISDIMERFAYPIPLIAKGHFKNTRTQAMWGRNMIWEYTPKNNIPAPTLLTPPPSILSSNLTGLNHLKEDYQTLTGFVNASIGQNVGSLQSGRGLIALQNGANLRNNPMLLELADTLTTTAKICLSFIQLLYTEERLVRRLGEHGTLEFTRINQVNTVGEKINDPTTGTFDIVFDVTSGGPTNFVARAEESVQLASAGLIDALTFVERSDFANKPRIIRRMVATGQIPAISAVLDGYLDENDPVAIAILGQPAPEEGQEGAVEEQGNTSQQLSMSEYINE